MRAGWNAVLEERLRRADPQARVMVDAVVEVASDVRRRRDQWVGADSTTNFELLLDSRVRLNPSLSTAISHTTDNADTTDLDHESPFTVAKIIWSGNQSHDYELHRIKAYLDPNTGGGKNVDKWLCQVFRTYEVTSPTGTEELDLVPMSTALAVNAGVSAGEVTFDFSNDPVRPREDRPLGGGTGQQTPTTYVFIWAVQSTGAAATNVGWAKDTLTSQDTENGHTMTLVTLTKLTNGRYTEAAVNHTPYLILEEGSYTEATLTFSAAGNRIDLGSAPSNDVELVAQAAVPVGCSVTYELNDDLTGVDPWHEFVDGDLVGVDNSSQGGKDLSSVTKQQEYLIRAKLTPNAAGDETPYLLALGAREISTTSLDELASVTSLNGYAIDPVELRGQIPTVTIRVLRSGEIDYQDPMSDLLATNNIRDLTFRLFVGHPDLDRQRWLHVDDFLIDDVDETGPALEFECVSPLALVRGVLPKYDSGTGKRTPIVYSNSSLKDTFDDLLQNQLEVATKYLGPGVEDDTTLVSKTIDDEAGAHSNGIREVHAIARLAGGGVTSSQGRIRFADMHRDGAPVVAFTSEQIEPTRIGPGYRSRIPEFSVKYEWIAEEKRFRKEVQRTHAAALTNLGRAPIDPPEELDVETARWIPDDLTLASTVAQRVVDTVGAGLLAWSFRVTDGMYPELEVGDLVAIQTDRFVAADPQTARAIRGSVWALGVISEAPSLLGREFTIWIRDYADIVSSEVSITRESYAEPEVVEVLPAIDVNRDVSVVVKTTAALSVRVASSTLNYPSLATTQAATAQTLDSDGVYSSGTLETIGPGDKLYITALAYENADGTGSESTTMGKALIIHSNVEVEPTTEAKTDGWSASQDAAAPETGDVVLDTEGETAYCNLEDANDIATTYTAYFDVDATAMPAGKTVTVRLYKPLDGPTTTSWELAASKSYTNADNLTDESLSFFGSLDVNYDLKLDITYDFTPAPLETATVTVHGEGHATPGVQYTKIIPESSGNIDASQVVTGTLVASRGGIGVSDPTSGVLLLGAGSSAMTELAPGPAGQYARSDGSAWARSSLLATDLTGTIASARLSGVYSGITGLGTQAQDLDMGGFNLDNVGSGVFSGNVELQGTGTTALRFVETDTTDLNAWFVLSGSVLDIRHYNDAGAFQKDLLQIDVSSGAVTIPGDLALDGTQITFGDADADVDMYFQSGVNGDASIRLTEAGDSGFRLLYDGTNNLLVIGSGTSSTYTSRLEIARDSGTVDHKGNDITNVGAYDGATITTTGDVTIGSLGTFDSSDAPNDLELLVYSDSDSKWIAEAIQFAWGGTDIKAGLLADNTAVSYILADPGTGSDSPVGAPDAPSAPTLYGSHESITCEVVDYSRPADFRYYEWRYSTDNFVGDDNALATTTSDKIVHARLDNSTTYYYKVRAVDQAGNNSAYSGVSSTTPTADASQAFGIILAAEIGVSNLAAISADIGEISAGQLHNSGDTLGILLSGALPGTWTSYIDFTATGTDSILQFDEFEVHADGVAVLKGQLDLQGDNIINQSLQDFHILIRDPDVAHGLTDLVETDVFGAIGWQDGLVGGLNILGFEDNGSIPALLLQGITIDTTPTSHAIVQIEAWKKSAATRTAPTGTDVLFGVSPGSGNDSFTVLANGQVFVGQGSESAPGLTFWNDADTGLYRNTTNEFSATAGGTQVAKFTGSGTVFPVVATIHQASASGDGDSLRFEQDDVAHGMTAILPTDRYGLIGPFSDSLGGLQLAGLTEDEVGLQLEINVTNVVSTKAGASLATIVMNSWVKSGTGHAQLDTTSPADNMVAMRNGGDTVFLFDAAGEGHSDVQWTTFADHNDVAVLGGIERAFGEGLLANRDEVERLDLAHDFRQSADGRWHAMVNWTRLSMLQVGAIRQTTARVASLEDRAEILEDELDRIRHELRRLRAAN